MKKRILLYCIALIIVSISCKNDDDTPPIDQLPEATQTGRGVFGALVNGEAFVETGNFFNTFYQQVDGEFFFGIQAEFENRNPFAINIATRAKTISEGEVLLLIEQEDGNAWGGVTFIGSSINDFTLAQTDSTNSGFLTVTKLDFENNIVSGTFEMKVVNPYTNQIVEITEGRFDTLFTQ